MIKSVVEKRSLLITLVLFLGAISQINASTYDEYTSISRYDYYTSEETAEIIVWIPTSKSDLKISFDVVFEYDHVHRGISALAGQMNLISVPMELLNFGVNELTVSYYENGKWISSNKVEIKILEHQCNAVKIDRLSGGLIVEDLPFIPFGFYAYSPVQPTLAEEEMVKGFNMMSPYQEIEGKTLRERKQYMDRCAALGMKVNYNLLSVAGGGGVNMAKNKKGSKKDPNELLRKEIETFRYHPALLSWYISDEPVGQGVAPEKLENAYNIIKELDPYHPVTIVFMSPGMARGYSHVMDIVMADPYPIPSGNVEDVGITAAMLYDEFFLEKPVWIVPQAFGGNEFWEREPTHQEMRAMTYLSIVNHAMGIQYFIRNGLNSFPKSTVAWNECGAMALEIAELTPYLFSSDPVPVISTDDEDIQLRGFHLNGSYVVIVVNKSNQPASFSFTLDDLSYSGSAAVMFENRKVAVSKGQLSDIIDAYGSRVYKVSYKMLSNKGPKPSLKNLIKDPSFENTTGMGIPASCYARPQADKGATYFIDPRESIRGTHSLRVTTPTEGEGMTLSFYRLRLDPGRSYTMSIQAKALPLMYRDPVKTKFYEKICGCGADAEGFPEFTMSFGTCKEYFTPDGEWQEYSFSCMPELTSGMNKVSPVLQMDGKGTAWFDLIQLYPDMGMKSFVSKENNAISIKISTQHKGAKIFYTTDGSTPSPESESGSGVKINKTSIVKAIAYKDGKQVGYIERYFAVSYATGRYVEYKYKYSPKYDAGLKNGLVDGVLGSSDFNDEKWQGFEEDNLDVRIHLKLTREVSAIELQFLKNQSSWIFLPEDIIVFWSVNGNDYYEFARMSDAIVSKSSENVYQYTFSHVPIEVRYIRIKAVNRGVCPDGHPGVGGKAWLFCDEIIIR